MMATLGPASTSSFLPLLKCLEDSTAGQSEQTDAYLTIANRLSGEEGRQLLPVVEQHFICLAKATLTHMISPNAELSQAALHALGFCVSHSRVVSGVPENFALEILSALCSLIVKSTDKNTCTRALWVLSKQSFPQHMVAKKVSSVLGALESVWSREDIQSVAMEQEALNVVVRMLEQVHVPMGEEAARWAKLVIPLVVHSSSKVRRRAAAAMEMGVAHLLEKQTEVAAIIEPMMSSKLIPELQRLFESKNEANVLKLWPLLVKLLGKMLHRGGPFINSLLHLEELGFRSSSPTIKKMAFIAWKSLIDNFALNPDILCTGKRMKLLMQPLTSVHVRTETLLLTKVEVWWYLVVQLGPNLSPNFDQVSVPLLQCAIGSDSSSLPSTPSRAVNQNGTITPGTPGFSFPSVQLLGLEMLLHYFLGPEVISTAAKNELIFSLEPLKHPLVSTASSFTKHAAALTSSIRDGFICIGSDAPESLLAVIWTNLVRCVNSTIESGSKKDRHGCEVLTLMLQALQSIISSEALPAAKVLVLFEATVKGVSHRVLGSASYQVGKMDVLNGTPALFLILLLYNSSMLSAYAQDERFFQCLQILVSCGLSGPTSPLVFGEAVLSAISRSAGSLQNKEQLWKMWSAVVSPLTDTITQSNEVNQGDALEHDFSAIHTALLFPITHLLNGTPLQQTTQNSMLSTWSKMYRVFARCSALVATAEENICCEEFCAKMTSTIDRQALTVPSTLNSIASILQVMVECVDFSPYTPQFLQKLKSHQTPVNGMENRNNILGNLSTFRSLLAQCLEVYLESPEASSEATGLALVSILSVLFTNLALANTVKEALTSLIDPIVLLYKRAACEPPVFTSQLLEKMEKLLGEVLTCLQNHTVWTYNDELLALLSPLLCALFSHKNKQLRSPVIQFWNSTFANSVSLTYPDEIRPILSQVKQKTPIILPGFEVVGVPDDPSSQCSVSQQNVEIKEDTEIVANEARDYASPKHHKNMGDDQQQDEMVQKSTDVSMEDDARSEDTAEDLDSRSKEGLQIKRRRSGEKPKSVSPKSSLVQSRPNTRRSQASEEENRKNRLRTRTQRDQSESSQTSSQGRGRKKIKLSDSPCDDESLSQGRRRRSKVSLETKEEVEMKKKVWTSSQESSQKATLGLEEQIKKDDDEPLKDSQIITVPLQTNGKSQEFERVEQTEKDGEISQKHSQMITCSSHIGGQSQQFDCTENIKKEEDSQIVTFTPNVNRSIDKTSPTNKLTDESGVSYTHQNIEGTDENLSTEDSQASTSSSSVSQSLRRSRRNNTLSKASESEEKGEHKRRYSRSNSKVVTPVGGMTRSSNGQEVHSKSSPLSSPENSQSLNVAGSTEVPQGRGRYLRRKSSQASVANVESPECLPMPKKRGRKPRSSLQSPPTLISKEPEMNNDVHQKADAQSIEHTHFNNLYESQTTPHFHGSESHHMPLKIEEQHKASQTEVDAFDSETTNESKPFSVSSQTKEQREKDSKIADTASQETATRDSQTAERLDSNKVAQEKLPCTEEGIPPNQHSTDYVTPLQDRCKDGETQTRKCREDKTTPSSSFLKKGQKRALDDETPSPLVKSRRVSFADPIPQQETADDIDRRSPATRTSSPRRSKNSPQPKITTPTEGLLNPRNSPRSHRSSKKCLAELPLRQTTRKARVVTRPTGRPTSGTTLAARRKVRLIKKKAASTISSHPGRSSGSADALCEPEIRDLKKWVAVMEKARCGHTECRASLDGITQRLNQMEERLKQMEQLLQKSFNPPPEPPQTANAATPPVRRQLTFKAEVDPLTPPLTQPLAAPVTPAPVTPVIPATPASATPLPDIDLRVLSAKREEDFYRQCYQRGKHRPEIYSANVFMALTPFEHYHRWGKAVNWSGSKGKAILPENLRRAVHQMTLHRFPDLSAGQWAKVRNRINERLRSPRKVDPEAHRFGFN